MTHSLFWRSNTINVMLNLEKLSKILFQWFSLNEMKGSHDLLPPTSEKEYSRFKGKKNSKPLRIAIVNNLNFQFLINKFCKKVSSKIHVLARVGLYMNIRERRLTINGFFNSRFG